MTRRKTFTKLAAHTTKVAFVFLIACAVVLCNRPAKASELAVLSNGFTIRHEHRLQVGAITRLFLSADDSSFTDIPTAQIVGYEKDLTSPVPAAELEPTTAIQTPSAAASSVALNQTSLNNVVNSASAAYHLDPDLVNSVIHAESGFNAHAVSRKGARGLMQLMPDTANQLGVTDSFNPQENVTGGSRYLRELLERYNFDLAKALAAYNAGPGRVEQYQGVPPYRETRAYVARIVHDYNQKKIAQEKQEKAESRKQQTAHKTAAKPSVHKLANTIAAKTQPQTQP